MEGEPVTVDMWFSLLGGLGLFIYGMRLMGDGLQKSAGDSLRRLLEILTTNPVMGVMVGTVVTALVQSSSATTVMVVGFVNAGLMTLRQAVGVIMGANIGTTITAQLIAFKLDEYALPAIGLGAALYLFGRTKRQRYIGQIFLGFGILFLGMSVMKDAMRPLREIEEFRQMLVSLGQNPLLGVLAGFALTTVVQSSSASIGILLGLTAQGLVDLRTALPILFGDNIGTTTTALLSSIGTTVAARRAALAHLTFNVIGSAVFLLIIPILIPVVEFTSADPLRQVANAHTLFNVTNTILQLPMIGLLVYIVKRLIPGEEAVVEHGPKFLDRRILESPSIAIGQVLRELDRMGRVAREMLATSMQAVLTNDQKLVDSAREMEVVINDLEKEITHYLVDLSKLSLTDNQAERVNALLNIVNDIERVGDHADNISELAEYKIDHQLTFSDTAVEDLKRIYAEVDSAVDKAVSALRKGDPTEASRVLELEDIIDDLQREMRARHICRLNEGKCHPTSGVVFLDIISNLERVGDHSRNVAQWILDHTRPAE